VSPLPPLHGVATCSAYRFYIREPLTMPERDAISPRMARRNAAHGAAEPTAFRTGFFAKHRLQEGCQRMVRPPAARHASDRNARRIPRAALQNISSPQQAWPDAFQKCFGR